MPNEKCLVKSILCPTWRHIVFSKDAEGGGAKVSGGAIPVPRLSGAHGGSKSPSPKLWRPAADTPSRARVSAGVRSQPRDRRGRADAGGALRSLLGSPQQVHT